MSLWAVNLHLQEFLDYMLPQWFNYSCPHGKQQNCFHHRNGACKSACIYWGGGEGSLKNIIPNFSSVSVKYGKKHPHENQLSLCRSKRKTVLVRNWPLWQTRMKWCILRRIFSLGIYKPGSAWRGWWGPQYGDRSHIHRCCGLRLYFNTMNVITVIWQDDKYYPMNHNT